MSIIKRARALFNPEIYQGWGKRKGYFEGWYFKLISPDEGSAVALIPGVAMDRSGNRHAFIQFLDGRLKTAEYHKYDFDSFVPSSERFLVSIGDSHFSEDSLSVSLPGCRGKLFFNGNIPWPKPWYSPGIMGPYSFVPFMQCYHGIVSMDHIITGKLEYSGSVVDFTGGRGYIEKDWGSSFPEGYIWLQSNHFPADGISIKTSVAKIPWLGSHFTGFISGLWLSGRLYMFTTYNGSELKKVSADESRVEIIIENRRNIIEIGVERDSATSLASPVLGQMGGRIEESMSSGIEVNLYERKTKKVLFSGKGRNAAVEVAGKVEQILSC